MFQQCFNYSNYTKKNISSRLEKDLKSLEY